MPGGAEGFMAGILHCSFNFLLHEQSCWAAKPPLCKGRCQRQLTKGLMQCSLPFAVQIPTTLCPKIHQLIIGSRMRKQTAGEQSPSRVVAKSVNSVFAFGAKSSVHFLTPPFPTEPTSLGFGGDPVREVVSVRTPEGLMQCSWISCAKSGYSKTNLPLYKGGRPSGMPSFFS